MVMDVLQGTFSLKKGKQLRKYTGHNGRVNSVCYGPNENVIVCNFKRLTFRLAVVMTLLSNAGIIDRTLIRLYKL
jgi:ribosomal protein L25 (general stress protein Ctc)